jgi:hypothetical protein
VKLDRSQTEQRDTEAVRLRALGHTWAEITQLAPHGGYRTPGAACQAVSRLLARRRTEKARAPEDLRDIELERLDHMMRACLDILGRDHVLVQGGKVVLTWTSYPDAALGELGTSAPMLDDGPKLAAVDRLLRISERRARLLGIDAPERVEQVGKVTVELVGVDLSALS